MIPNVSVTHSKDTDFDFSIPSEAAAAGNIGRTYDRSAAPDRTVVSRVLGSVAVVSCTLAKVIHVESLASSYSSKAEE